MQKEAKENY
ncbi:Protein of unknown function [Bacillus mycoides]|nr:Protein of unknown function [Bacillus mycoides]